MKLVSLQAASDHLRRDTTDDDADLELKIEAASSAVLAYLKYGTVSFPLEPSSTEASSSEPEIELDSEGVAVNIPEQVRMATLILVGSFYKQREGDHGESPQQWTSNYLPPMVQTLLYPFRSPTLA